MNEVCIANIGLRQRRLRLRLGLVGLAAAGAVATAPFLLGLDPALRWWSLPFVFGGLQGVLQHRENT